jgi:hypothetical protein
MAFTVALFSIPVANLSVLESEINSGRRNQFLYPHRFRIFIVEILTNKRKINDEWGVIRSRE